MRERYAGSHKYGFDPFAAWLDTIEPDETFGDVTDMDWHYARFGHHVLITDVYGFVKHERWTEQEWQDAWEESDRWANGETGVWQ